MKLPELHRTCMALPHTFHVVQWGGVNVWKVGGPTGKMFALGFDEGPKGLFITFKVSALSYDLMKEQEGLRPAPYLASRGMTWIQRTSKATLDDKGLKAYIKESHRLCAMALPKGVQKKMGLVSP
jgi:predicted DNA-binding protein (MmcQ/YjbR family)